jgi:hypothetical protein
VGKAHGSNSQSNQEGVQASGRHEELGDFSTSLRVLPISGLAVVIGALCAFVALALLRLIGLFTNLFYFGRWSTAMVSVPHGGQRDNQAAGRRAKHEKISWPGVAR